MYFILSIIANIILFVLLVWVWVSYRLRLKDKERVILNEKAKKKEAESQFSKRQEDFKEQIKLLTQNLINQGSQKISEQNKTNLEDVLKPFKETLHQYQQKMEEVRTENVRERSALKTELKTLVESSQLLGQQAKDLTQALKGDKQKQGAWGESQLQVILEQAGLQEGKNFVTQSSYKNEDGDTFRPDCVVHLPQDKHIIIDAKVTLNSYVEYTNAETEDHRNQLAQIFVRNIKAHIDGLSQRSYEDLVGITSPDYVLMYLPIETAFFLAIETDADLMSYAMRKNVALVSNSTLLFTMRTVAFIWKQESITENAQEIARRGGALYDKFVGFTEDLISVGKSMDTAKEKYHTAMNKLYDGKGNLVRQAEQLKSLGINHKKEINSKLVERSNAE